MTEPTTDLVALAATVGAEIAAQLIRQQIMTTTELAREREARAAAEQRATELAQRLAEAEK